MSEVKKAVITAAGRGTRHFPATRTVQKELFPLVDRDGFTKPVLQIVVEEALESGIERVCIICNPDSIEPIRSHFSPVSGELRRSLESKPPLLEQAEHLDRLVSTIELLVQPTPEGFGDAVLCARDFVGDEPFLLLLGDHVYTSHEEERCAHLLIRTFDRVQGPVSGVARTPEDQLHLFGVVKGEALDWPDTHPLYHVLDMVEKPTPEVAQARLQTPGLDESYLGFFGMHVLTPEVFRFLADRKARDLREGGEIQLTSSLEDLLHQGDYYAVEVPGDRLDMGVPEGLLYTQRELALLSPYKDVMGG